MAASCAQAARVHASAPTAAKSNASLATCTTPVAYRIDNAISNTCKFTLIRFPRLLRQQGRGHRLRHRLSHRSYRKELGMDTAEFRMKNFLAKRRGRGPSSALQRRFAKCWQAAMDGWVEEGEARANVGRGIATIRASHQRRPIPAVVLTAS